MIGGGGANAVGRPAGVPGLLPPDAAEPGDFQGGRGWRTFGGGGNPDFRKTGERTPPDLGTDEEIT